MSFVDTIKYVCLVILYFCNFVYDAIFYKKQKKLCDGVVECFKPYHHLKLSSQSICKKVFTKNLLRPKELNLGNLFERFIGDCLGCINTDKKEWGLLKKIFKPIFDQNNDIIIDKINKTLILWDIELNDIYSKQTSLNKKNKLIDIICSFPLKFILFVIFGDKFVSKHNDIFEELQLLAKDIMSNVFNNTFAKYTFYKFFPTKTNKALNKFYKLWNTITQLAINQLIDSNDCLFGKVYKNYKQYEQFVTYEMFSQTLIEIIFANQDVTLPSAMWMLYYYSKFEHKLNYSNIDYFIEECSRCSPIFPTSMPKITTDNIDLENGVIIKKNTLIVIDFFDIGLSNEWNMTNLNDFEPDRFKTLENNLRSELTINDFISKFGYGARKCPGKNIGNLLFRKALLYVFQNWEFQLSHSKSDLVNIELEDMPFLAPKCNIKLVNRLDKIIKSKIMTNYGSPTQKFHEMFFVGISVSDNSPYLKDNDLSSNLIKLLKLQNKKCVILIADSISKYNYQAFDGLSETKAMTKANDTGQKLFNIFYNSTNENNCSDFIKICRWDDLQYPEFTEQLKTNKLLDDRIEQIGENFINKRHSNSPKSQKKIDLVKKYIYSELSVLVCGVCFNNEWYRILCYSGSNAYLKEFYKNEKSLCRLIDDIIVNNEFDDTKKIIMSNLNTNKCKKIGFFGIDTTKL